ncbi:hypothetical protein SAMN05421736_1022 [Evansella caseinilytica]|uniref:Uncharacterized protein n=1 Tax=Evansella caseinilytica TaxID=1503961 RepID=A0A1H3JYS9_9BACI|nr:hypothetical protein [Evansella caseinilytica]SDY45103.1 hypothetical protein SAMN05421736_1022 [Evansella caseinilytica]
MANYSNVGPAIDDRFRKSMNVHSQMNSIIDLAEKQIAAISKEMKAEDQYNQEVVFQMYFIEIMLQSMYNDLYHHLDGKYKEAVMMGIFRLRQMTFNVNEQWEDLRRTFD